MEITYSLFTCFKFLDLLGLLVDATLHAHGFTDFPVVHKYKTELLNGPPCLHLNLSRHGNSYKIALAYMNKALNWPAIKPEDSNDLWSNALFLRSCYNIMQNITGLKELENSTNLRIVSKLPFRLRDRWQANVCSLQDKIDHRTIHIYIYILHF